MTALLMTDASGTEYALVDVAPIVGAFLAQVTAVSTITSGITGETREVVETGVVVYQTNAENIAAPVSEIYSDVIAGKKYLTNFRDTLTKTGRIDVAKQTAENAAEMYLAQKRAK